MLWALNIYNRYAHEISITQCYINEVRIFLYMKIEVFFYFKSAVTSRMLPHSVINHSITKPSNMS